eukprot:CAMPEP_0172319666 /NCGR_PEP_ID=MMETSP1058-20130122/38329_1 /TAXON_ID=83371 /ORGANISM="Detonula confervacea, Strain CCMP 353" /LENGTH=130 /DNA_ID=CAMNT_0013034761 /DNA_START=153 /DNA_END=545 /DNA_ORIENTATION=+
MVQSLPNVGLSLCGDDDLPNEACAYFASEEDVLQFQNRVEQQLDSDIPDEQLSNVVLPYAITFQAHPEYVTPTGIKVNYVNTVKLMEERGFISRETYQHACEDASRNFGTLTRDCLDATVSTAVVLGWFK